MDGSLGLNEEAVDHPEDDDLHTDVDEVVFPGNGIQGHGVHPLVLSESESCDKLCGDQGVVETYKS